MPTGFSEGDDDAIMWDELIKFAQKENIIIVGDFNVYIGCDQKLTEKKYKQMLEYMGNCVSESIITFGGKTSIDKIMLRKVEAFNNIEYTIFRKKQKQPVIINMFVWN